MRALYDAQHSVVLVARNEEKLKAIASSFVDKDRVLIVTGDITIDSDIEHVLERGSEHFDHVDAVINAAGTWKKLNVDTLLSDALPLVDAHYREHARPVFSIAHTFQLFFRNQKQKGLIINISSHAGYRPELEGNLSYGPAKAFARLLMQSYAIALKKKGVRFCDIAPAIVNTPENFGLLSTPKKRKLAVQPETIANWIVRHLSDKDIPALKNFKAKKGLVV